MCSPEGVKRASVLAETDPTMLDQLVCKQKLVVAINDGKGKPIKRKFFGCA